jgi:hypothetical protein
MKTTNNEMRVILEIAKSLKKSYNANSLSKVLGITSMGALKILKKLEKEEILSSKKFGKASFYEINFNNKYALDYVKFLLKNEAEFSNPYIKRWIRELRKIDEAYIIIIFGSVLKIKEKANDVDTLFVIEKKKFDSLKSEIEKLNRINDKKIHPVYQTLEDLKSNILKEDKIILESIKGIVTSGEDKLINFIKNLK